MLASEPCGVRLLFTPQVHAKLPGGQCSARPAIHAKLMQRPRLATLGQQLFDDQRIHQGMLAPKHHQRDHLEFGQRHLRLWQIHGALDDDFTHAGIHCLGGLEKGEEAARGDIQLGHFRRVVKAYGLRGARFQRMGRTGFLQTGQPVKGVGNIFVFKADCG